MAADDWWAQAVDQFGLDDYIEPAAVDPASPVAAGVAKKGKRKLRVGVEWLIIGVFALAAALLMRAFVVQQFAVDGESMMGTLHSGDRVIVNKLSYRLHDPRHGDVVVMKADKASLEVRDLIKRVVALPGETIEYRECQLFVDGERVDESYLDPSLVRPGHCGDSQALVKVEAGRVFVMGDNRNASLDSRAAAIGQIPFGHLIGRAFVVVWPFSDWSWL
ncbi:MAG: signal peptidase I [Ilumatobacteraceae bacterium]